jgi:hypothetical protein
MNARSHFVFLSGLAIALAIIAGSGVARAQVTMTVPFKFEAGGKSFPPGEYSIGLKQNGAIGLRSGPNGVELVIPAKERLKQRMPPINEPELVFDMVGNFEPSYSEYVTDYLLSEVWLPDADGVIVLTTSGKHQHRTVKGRLTAPTGCIGTTAVEASWRAYNEILVSGADTAAAAEAVDAKAQSGAVSDRNV